MNFFIQKLLRIAILFFFFNTSSVYAQHSIARQWNEKVLDAIRADFARPTVHARNLYHTSVAMYDAWAVYEAHADTYFLGKTVNNFPIPLQPIKQPTDKRAAQEMAMSYAVYRLIHHRFQNAPRAEELLQEVDAFMESLGYNSAYTMTDYTCSAAGMGNYIAQKIIEYGLVDGSNEIGGYANLYYQPANERLAFTSPGNPYINNPNRWQSLLFGIFVDQGGTPSEDVIPSFLGAEWGNVYPFSLKEEDATYFERDENTYKVYHDPGVPALTYGAGTINDVENSLPEEYAWGHSLVSVWSSHLDHTDGVMWDISPASIGNLDINTFPNDIVGLRHFYDLENGGDPSVGHSINPITNQSYTPQIVPRGDYTRVLAEFWADGPDSETPPGHWFTILNYVNDNPALEKRFKGQGVILDDLEWDVKSYFILGGAMHDAAISAWSVKGWYDYIRPLSAIRFMIERGQSSDSTTLSYSHRGIPLVPGYIEVIENESDPMAGPNGQFVGEIKLKAWRGDEYVNDPNVDVAGVDWIYGKRWMPYQRPTFVTPPFAGYVSGHSTFSRAAAEVLTMLTGDAFFPGGMGEFYCPKNEFLVFENGPSVDVTLQWATYRDAADQCSLSRIWGGIHPPCDDIPGRIIGEKVGIDAFQYAAQYFQAPIERPIPTVQIYPNPTNQCLVALNFEYTGELMVQVYHANGQMVKNERIDFMNNQALVDLTGLDSGVYFVQGVDNAGEQIFVEKLVML